MIAATHDHRDAAAPTLRRWAGALGVAVAALGAIVLLGWALHVEALRSLVPGYVPMAPNAAAGLLLGGISVALQSARSPPRPVRVVARLLAAGALAIGALTLLEHMFLLGDRFDELLLAGADRDLDARMPVTSALALAMLGTALLFLRRETPRGHRPAQILALGAGLIPLQALVGYVYGLAPRGGLSPYTQVALHSGLGFGMLCLAVLLARPGRGLMRVVTSADVAGVAARRMLVAIALIPLLLGWIFLVAGLRAGHYEALVGATFVVISAIATGGAVVWWTAREIQRIDEARSRAEEAMRDEREWLSTTLASIGDGVVAADEDGRVRNLNAVAEALTGWSSELAAGRAIDEVLRLRGADGAPVESPFRWVVREERVADLPRGAVLVARSGAEFPVEGSVAPIREARGRTAGVVLVFRDIRDRQAVEAARRDILEREQAARAQAEAASRAKDEFIATLSHELRTPLNSVLGWARLLRIGKLDADGVRRAVEAIERGATTQAQIVDDLLDVARIVRGQLRLDVRAVDLVPVVDAALETVRPAASARGIELAASLDPAAGPVAGDPGRLQQVVWNLVSNAIKFTPEGGRVDVRLARDGAQVRLVVQDTGAGIPPEFIAHVFERFRQADSSTTRAHGGLGLGLAIVRHLVEAHGGTVSAESAGPGAGSTFTVSLPAAPARALARAAGEAPPRAAPAAPLDGAVAGLDRLRVLVVDDDRDTLDVLRQLLEQAGARVVSAASAEEALSCLEREVPDVLVSDIGMPGRDGYALLREVRARPADRGGAVPAAALTAFTQGEARDQALRAGFQLYIAKPVDPAELARAVARLAGRG